MNLSEGARALGRRGGEARARTLAPAERRRIASLGGLSKSLSRHAARRILDNFRYLEAVEALRAASRGD